MEMQLQELIEQIKKNGVQVAENEADSIIKAAEDKAKKIIADAEAEAQKRLSDSKEESERFVKVGEESIRQAGRNVLLSFRESISKELNSLITSKISETYSSKELTELIVKAVESWSKNPDVDDISVLLNAKDMAALEGGILSAFNEHMLKGVTLKANDSFDGGFRIAVNNASVYYDYSTQAVTDMMSEYLSPKVAQLLKEAEKI